MNAKPDTTALTAAITANIAALNVICHALAQRTAEARDHALRGERNAAIGTLVDCAVRLEEAKALYGAAMALHRAAPF